MLVCAWAASAPAAPAPLEDPPVVLLFYDGGFNVIDATILHGPDRYYLVVKDETRHLPARRQGRRWDAPTGWRRRGCKAVEAGPGQAGGVP